MSDTNLLIDARKTWLEISCKPEKEAEKVVIDTLKKCLDALKILSTRLSELGYPIHDLVIPSESKLTLRVETLESNLGMEIPQVLKKFWEIVGGVDSINVDSNQHLHVDFWENKIGIQFENDTYTDAIYVERCHQVWIDYCVVPPDELDDPRYYFELSPDKYHKDGVSGGGGYGLVFDSNWLPTWDNFEWCGPKTPESAPSERLDFISYLRTSILECGGFPGLYGNPTFEPIRKNLTQNLPIF